MEKFDIHYDDPKLTALYDLDSGWSKDRDFYLSLADKPHQRVLDLGCGTGLLCNAYAEKGHIVTGVDPSAEMLKIAYQKKYGEKIKWVQASAQNYKSDSLFDLIVMTGHAFQTLHEDKDIEAAYATIRSHLSSQGRVVFESRNPEIDWKNNWTYEIEIQTPTVKVHESRKFIEMSNDSMIFELYYEFPTETLVSKSKLRFLSKGQIEDGLNKAGLIVEKLLGDWDGQPFDAKLSQEMIFVARAAA